MGLYGDDIFTETPGEADTLFNLGPLLGSATFGILSNPFLDEAFRTVSYQIHVTVNGDTWSYEEDGVMEIPGQDEPFHHIDGTP